MTREVPFVWSGLIRLVPFVLSGLIRVIAYLEVVSLYLVVFYKPNPSEI
jgi:hypothetical protein